MSKFNLLGLILILGGIVMVIFQAVSAMMAVGEIVWEPQSLISVFGEEAFSWIETLPAALLQNVANFIASMQIYILLIALGAISLLAGMITKD